MSARVLWTLAAVAALSGCASTPVFEGGRPWSEGWREGKVEKVGNASELGSRHTYDCRYREDGAGREAQGRFAVVGMQNMTRHRHHVVPVEAGKEPQIGDSVLTNWHACQPPLARSGK